MNQRQMWRSVSNCPPIRTVYYYATEAEAEEAKAFIDECGCGGQCDGRHKVLPPLDNKDENRIQKIDADLRRYGRYLSYRNGQYIAKEIPVENIHARGTLNDIERYISDLLAGKAVI